MTTQGNNAVRLLVIGILSLATIGMAAISMRANYLFGYGFGQTSERAEVFGWANVAADLWKIAGLIVIAGLWRAEQKRFAFSLMPIWLLCLLWGFTGAIGVYAQDRTALIGGRESVAASYKERERELEEVEAKLRTLHVQRGVNQVEAAIAAVMARPIMVGERVRGTVGKLSNNCAKDDRATAEACQEVAKLREERAASEEASKLEIRKSALRVHIEKLRDGGAAQSSDPVAELFAWLSRGQLSVRDISFGFPLIFALLIEIVSAFGPAGIVAYAEATRGMSVEGSMLQPAVAGSSRVLRAEPEDSSVASWLLERAVPGDGAIAAQELYGDYQLWCRRSGLNPASFEVFIIAFDFVRENPELELREKIRKFGKRYYGIKLRSSENVMRLPRR